MTFTNKEEPLLEDNLPTTSVVEPPLPPNKPKDLLDMDSEEPTQPQKGGDLLDFEGEP